MAEPADPDHGALRFFTDAWPLFALGIIAAVIVRACVPDHQSPLVAETASRFDASTAEKTVNGPAVAALSALAPESGIEQVLQALNLVSIDFGTGRSTLPDASEPVLAMAAAAISARPVTERFEVSARADGMLSPLADLELSRRRSQGLVDFLVIEGVPAQRLQARPIGDQDPVAGEPGHDLSLRNQRIQFTLLP
jgi:outer membrane protein OmpA-like peptidoglycan-associated protein